VVKRLTQDRHKQLEANVARQSDILEAMDATEEEEQWESAREQRVREAEANTTTNLEAA
jgi:DNA-binding transcriptional regulator WhiA